MDWRKAVVKPDATIRDAMAAIDNGAIQICVIVAEDGTLTGVVTDGDIRRAILGGAALETLAIDIMVASPYTAPVTQAREELSRQMDLRQIRQIPLLDDNDRLVSVAFADEFRNLSKLRPNPVVLMAGGRGTRLQPLTNDMPKPMLKVGDKPILETIISRFVDQGFCKIFLSVNYRAEIIQDYFRDGSWLGADISYLEEAVPMGTAGALSLLPDTPQHPIIVMNGDILTQVDFRSLVAYHNEQSAAATMALREFGYSVPFGVVNVDDHQITGIEEKPNQQFLVNAGIYVVGPATLGLIPSGEASDIPDLFKKLIQIKKPLAAFLIHEYWVDVGRSDDFNRANAQYNDVFGQ